MSAISSRRRGGAADYTWPGYVDALTTLLMVLIFLLTLFSVGQFTLSSALTTRDSAIDRLGKQVGDLASQLSIEKKATQSLQKDLEHLTLQFRQERSERDRLSSILLPSAIVRCAQGRARPAHRTPDLDDGRARKNWRRRYRARPRNQRPRLPTCRRRSSASA
jgi:chemotaxis protein MotB